MQASQVARHPQKQKIEIPIIGGPFDRLTAVLEEFEPGEQGFIIHPEQCGVCPRTVSHVVEREVEVIVPARLHLAVLDMNRFSIERVGGGGIGLGIGVYMRARVRSTKEPEIVVNGERPLIALHFARVFKEILQYPGGLVIELDDHKRRHVGLGSSSGTMCAACIGINEVLGRPFNNRELRRITGYNACEESPSGNGYIIRTFETGIGSMVGINGGLVVGSDDAELIYRAPLEDTKVIILIPDVPSLEDEYTGKDTAADAEVGLLLRRARCLDARMGNPKAHMILLDLLPAIIKGNLEAIGEALLDISFTGSKRAECEQHGLCGAPIFNYIGLFREMGAEAAGMSSVGPTVFALTRKPLVYNRILKYLHDQGFPSSRIIETEVDNTGARIIENSEERNYLDEGWLQG
jgi:beta-ribofuranosylaminobenzene 5'-phosphate synthase